MGFFTNTWNGIKNTAKSLLPSASDWQKPANAPQQQPIFTPEATNFVKKAGQEINYLWNGGQAYGGKQPVNWGGYQNTPAPVPAAPTPNGAPAQSSAPSTMTAQGDTVVGVQNAPTPNPGLITWGDGSTTKVGANGQLEQVSGPSNQTPGTTADVNISPTTSTDSSLYSGSPSTANDVQSVLTQNEKAQDELLNQIYQLGQPTSQEQAALANYTNLTNSYNMGQENIAEQPIALEFQQGQGAALQRTYGNQIQAFANVYNALNATRQQKLQAASTLFNARQTQTNDWINNYLRMAPQNIGTQVNQSTGDIMAITKNPVTGEVTTKTVGNIGPSQAFTSSQITTLPDGSTAFVGVTGTGQVVTKPLYSASGQKIEDNGQTSSYTPGTSSNSLNGSFPPGAQSTPNSAAAVNNVVGMKSGGSFVPYASPMQSFQAAEQDIANKQSGNTSSGLNGNSSLNDFVRTWILGPKGAKTNTPTNYTANDIAKYLSGFGVTGVTANTPIGQIPTVALTAAVAKAETGFTLNGYGQGGITAGGNQGAQVTPQQVQQVVSTLPQVLQGAVKYLPDGTPYIDGNQLNGQQQVLMAQNVAGSKGIPYINSSDATRLNTISTTLNQLQSFKNVADSKLIKAPGALTGAAYTVGNWFGGSTKTQFSSNYATALASIESLAAGAGTGFRMTNTEVNTAIANLPTIWDSKAQADTKIDTLQNLLYAKIEQSLPGWQRPANGSTAGTDYTSILNQLAGK